MAAAGLLIGAAAPSDTAIAPLSPPSWSARVQAKHALTASNVMYQAAPMPNPDASGPPDTSKPEPQLGPTFISSRSLFKGDGDGYSFASSEEASMDGRRRAAAGVGLSVPLTDDK
jgi:hypothetical protein